MNTKKYTDFETVQKKIWWAVVYPDSTSYDCMEVLDRAEKHFPQFAYAYHDKDVVTADDLLHSDKYSESDIGTPKKPHFHLLWIDDKCISRGRCSNILGLPSNYIQEVANKTKALRYLFHKDNPEKAQYDANEVRTNIPDFVKRYSKDEDGTMKAQKITTYIFQSTTYLTLADVVTWALENYCWDELRRGQHLFTALINEHNNLIGG